MSPTVKERKHILSEYTLARKDYIHKVLFSESISRKKYISVTRNSFWELISRKLHITYSFVIQRITWKKCFGNYFPGKSHFSYTKQCFRNSFCNTGWSVQIEYGFDCFQVRFGLVGSTVWIGSEYGFVNLLDESASGNHTQNSTRTAPYSNRCDCDVMILESQSCDPPAISCRFLRMCPPKTAFSCRKVHFSAGKCIFLQESAFFGRKLHFSVGKCFFLPENLFFCSLLRGG